MGTTTGVGPVPRRLTPIFRDKDELSASHDLGGELTAALRDSMFLLVICSPASARSKWVTEEILAFKRLYGESRVLALIVAGRPRASDRPGEEDQECFPRTLRHVVGHDGDLSAEIAHPIAADIREGQDSRQLAKMKLIAGLTGIRLDDVVQREAQRRMRRLAYITAASVTGMVVAGGLALYANVQRTEAEHQRHVAEEETVAARAANDFLIGTFRLTNPAKENPRTVTALTILDRGATRVRKELASQPDTEARMLTTVGAAYNNLGLSAEARDLLEQSRPELSRAGEQGARALDQLSYAYIKLGRLDAAMAVLNDAHRQMTRVNSRSVEIMAELEQTKAAIQLADGKPEAAVLSSDRALALFGAARSAPPKSVAQTLKVKGKALSDDGRFGEADAALAKALEIYRESGGDDDLRTGESWLDLALNDLANGNLSQADVRVQKALFVLRHVLDSGNPVLADAISIQGQIYQGEQKLAPAAASLGEAIAIYKAAYGHPHYNIGITLVYLALVESDLGHTAQALADLDEAKHNYDVSYGKLHPNHGDLLVNRARVLAHAGRRKEAAESCAAGIKILDQTLGADAAFTKANVEICAKL